MKQVLDQVDFLRRLSRSKQSEKLLAQATDAQLLALVELALNLLKGRLPIRNLQKEKLREHAPYLRKVSRVRSPKTALRQLQHGGNLVPTLLASIAVPFLLKFVE